MRFSDIIRLGRDIFDARAIPMMTSPSYQVARMQITAYPRLFRQVRMVAQIDPDINIAINKSQLRGLDIVAAVFKVLV